MNLEEIKTLPKNPDETFRFNSQNLDFRLVDFWKWSQSDLIENRNRGLLEDNNYSEEKLRRADIYIFCLLGHKDQTTINPMNLNQWVFYVLPVMFICPSFF